MSEKRHKLLARQLRKHFPDGVPPEMEAFLDTVNDSYQHYEADRTLMDRAMAISSRELMEKNQELQLKNSSLDSFIYRVSHDLKTPANNVISMVNLLRKEIEALNPNPMTVKILAHLEGASQGMLVRLKDLLELTRMEKMMDTKVESIDLPEVTAELLACMSSDITAHQAQFETSFEECPQVMFGKENMRSLLGNLLSNALKYRSPDRPPVVQMVSKRHGPWVILEISDNGLGIDLERDGAKLFGMFNRFHSHVEGTGVGLYIVKRILEGHGGKIEVESQVGEGTTFRLYLRRPAVAQASTPELA